MTLGKREATVNWHCVENWLWKGLWACRTAGCRVSELWMQHGDINCIIRCGWGLRFWDATCVGSAFRCAVGCVVRWINIHMSCWMCRALDQHSHVLLDVSCVGSAFTCPVGCFVRWISIQMSCWMRRALDQHSDILLDVRCPVGCVVRWISIQMSVGCVVVLNDLYPSQIIRRNSSRSMTWMGHVARMGWDQKCLQIFTGKYEGKWRL